MTARTAKMSFTQIALVNGRLTDLSQKFTFSGAEHSSAQGDIDLHLKVETIRKAIPGGSGTVVEHMMSATWQPFEISGEWDDKWGNRAASQFQSQRSGAFAFTTYQQFAQFVQKMPFVRFEIDELSLVGIITDFKVKYRHYSRIGWQITFSPHINETTYEVRGPALIPTQPIPSWLLSASDVNDRLNGSLKLLQSLSLKTEILNTIKGKLLALDDGLDRMNGFVADGLSGSDINTTLLLMATTFGRIRAAALDTSIAVASATSSDHLAYDNVLNAVTFQQWCSDTFTDSMTMVGLTSRAERDIRARAGKNPIAIYYPKPGENLERISAKFYGTEDAWRLIYDASNLHSLVLDGTEELFIPRRRAA